MVIENSPSGENSCTTEPIARQDEQQPVRDTGDLNDRDDELDMSTISMD